MNKKIAILRGINVGGKRKVLMADLKILFQNMGYKNVSTYIQSGNVLFDVPGGDDNETSAKKLEEAIKRKFNFDVPVIVRTPDELECIVRQSPYCKSGEDISQLHLTFLGTQPTVEKLNETNLYDASPDVFEIKGMQVFIRCEGSYHKSKLSNNFFEKHLNVNATTRNLKTILKLVELSKS